MNEHSHQIIAEKGIDWLPGAAGAYWKPFKETARQAANFPDYFYSGELVSSELQDQYPDWRDYILIPDMDGKPCHTIFDTYNLKNTYFRLINYWSGKTLNEMKCGNGEKAAMHAGCISHLIGDTGQPAHIIDHRLLNRLFPQNNFCFIYHKELESINGNTVQEEYSPRQLAINIQELNWRLLNELELLKRNEMAEIVPLLQGIMAKDDCQKEKSASRTLTHCAELFCDFLYSIWNISNSKTEDVENELHLTNLIPEKQYCDEYFNYEIMVDRMPGKAIDQPVPLNIGTGENVKGICLLPRLTPLPGYPGTRDAFVEYQLPPPGSFHYFQSVIGLNRDVGGKDAEAVFAVLLDDEIVFESTPLGTSHPPGEIKVELGQAKKIRLYVRDSRTPPCSVKFFYPVFAFPRLTERKNI